MLPDRLDPHYQLGCDLAVDAAGADQPRYLNLPGPTRPRPSVCTLTSQSVRADEVPARLRGRRTPDGRFSATYAPKEERRMPGQLRRAPLPPLLHPTDDEQRTRRESARLPPLVDPGMAGERRRIAKRNLAAFTSERLGEHSDHGGRH